MTDKTDKTGGPAFPQGKGVGEAWVSEGGMDLRDYFAAKAMQSRVSRGSFVHDPTHIAVAAQFAYEMADAMLKERSK